MRTRLSVLMLAATLATTALSASGATNTFMNLTGDHDWHNGANWSLGRTCNSTDDVVVTFTATDMRVFITGGTTCRSLISNNPVNIAGGTLQVLNNAEFNRELVIVYGTSSYGTYYGNGITNLRGGAHFEYAVVSQPPGAEINFVAGTQSSCVGPVYFAGGAFNIYGYMELGFSFFMQGGAVYLGNYDDADPSTTLNIFAGGSARVVYGGGFVDRSDAGHNAGNSLIANRGAIFYEAGGSATMGSDIQYWAINGGYLVVGNGSSLDIRNCVNLSQTPETYGYLYGGTWIIQQDSALRMNSYQSIHSLQGAYVAVSGPSSALLGLEWLFDNHGTLVVDNGKLLQIAAGVLRNYSDIFIGAGAAISCQSTFEQHSGTITRYFTSVEDTTRMGIFAYTNRIYGGTASVHVTTPAAVFPGAGYYVCNAQVNGLQGQFAGVNIDIPFAGNFQSEYRPAWAAVRVVPDCPGDFNNDRAVNTGDLVLFLSEFGDLYFLPSDPIDMNFDGAVNTTDLTMFLARFGATCP